MTGNLLERLSLAYWLAESDAARSLAGYLRHVVINSQPEPRAFRLVAHQWQYDLVRNIIPALEDVAGIRPGYVGPRSFWRTLPRGHDKTSSVARLLNWCLAFSRKPLQVVAAAGDHKQAKLLRDAMQSEAKLNPWLWRRLDFDNYEVDGPGGHLEVISADAQTSYGFNADIIVCDEKTHWRKRELWTALWSGRRKRPRSVYIVATNAGYIGTWQHAVVANARLDPDWDVYEAPGQLNTWMDRTQIDKDRALLPEVEARRLFDNQWVNQSPNSVWTEEAWSRIESVLCEPWELRDEWCPEIGCDVARFGTDATAIHVRQGPCSLFHQSFFGANGRTVATKLKEVCHRFGGLHHPKRIPVKVDETGAGFSVMDHSDDYRFIPVNSACAANDPTRFKNVRSELWFNSCELAVAVGHDKALVDLSRLEGDTRQVLRQQLYSPTYEYGPGGIRIVEEKKETKKRLGRSPDDADAFNLAYYIFYEPFEKVAGNIN